MINLTLQTKWFIYTSLKRPISIEYLVKTFIFCKIILIVKKYDLPRRLIYFEHTIELKNIYEILRENVETFSIFEFNN